MSELEETKIEEQALGAERTAEQAEVEQTEAGGAEEAQAADTEEPADSAEAAEAQAAEAQAAEAQAAEAQAADTEEPADSAEAAAVPVERAGPEEDLEENIAKLSKFKKTPAGTGTPGAAKRTRDEAEHGDADTHADGQIDQTEEIEDEQTRKRREFEEKFNALLKKPAKKRKNNDVDLEAMQDEAISHLKNMMKDAAYMDIDCVNNKKPATNKLKLLPQVKETLLKSNLYDSILDNNLLEAVRIWLEPLPDASLPSFEIQKTLLNELAKLPIKTIHLRESGLGKVIIFYQKSKKVDPALKRVAEKLIGDWTRPVMGRSDNYRAREIPTANFDLDRFQAKTKLQSSSVKKTSTRKSLYQESADRRKRAAAPEARTSVYTIAPQSNLNALHSQRPGVSSVGLGSSINRDERFKAINRKLTLLSQKKKAVKKDGVSIEGRGLNTNM